MTSQRSRINAQNQSIRVFSAVKAIPEKVGLTARGDLRKMSGKARRPVDHLQGGDADGTLPDPFGVRRFSGSCWAARWCRGRGWPGHRPWPLRRSRAEDGDADWRLRYETGWEALNQRDYDAAEQWLRASFETARPFPNNDLRKVASVGSLGWLRVVQGRYAAAEPLAEWALTVREKMQGPEHLDVAFELNTLATAYWYQARYAEAEPLYRRALATAREGAGRRASRRGRRAEQPGQSLPERRKADPGRAALPPRADDPGAAWSAATIPIWPTSSITWRRSSRARAGTTRPRRCSSGPWR